MFKNSVNIICILLLNQVYYLKDVSASMNLDEEETMPFLASKVELKNELILQKNVDDNMASCFSFKKIICFFSQGRDNSEKRNTVNDPNLMEMLPFESVINIAEFLDPLSIVNFSLTSKEVNGFFSDNYWKIKCLQKGITPWEKNVKLCKVYIANFFYQSKNTTKIRKAASIGHPESKQMLKNMKSQEFSYGNVMNFTSSYPESIMFSRKIHRL